MERETEGKTGSPVATFYNVRRVRGRALGTRVDAIN